MTADSQSSESSDRYCIIGAGPAGLCMAAEFKRRGIEYDHLESHTSLGGIWEIGNPDSPIYESAHFISSKTQSGFLDFPMPESYPDYPSHRQVLEYLQAFAHEHQLAHHIQFKTPVKQVVVEGGAALVKTSAGTKSYRGVVCASGTNWEPIMPQFDGHFDGELRHTKSYRKSEELSGKRVVIVGLGNSGADIACDAARAASQVWVSVRRGYHFIPKHVFGMPTDVFAHEGPHLPLWLERPLFGLLLKVIMGDMQKLGMPKPDHALLDCHPLMNDQLVHHLRHGDVSIKPDVAKLDGSRVLFTDGTSVEADVVLCATGYRRRIPYLDEHYLEGSWAAGNFLTCFSRKYHNLFTLGFAELNGALYPQLSRMATLIGHVAECQSRRAHEAEEFFRWAETTRFDLSGGRKLIGTPRHAHYCDEHALTNALKRALRKTKQRELRLPRAPAELPAPSASSAN